ncbi:hypothetical protein BC827DRAFT_1268936 [Russula dissimulans]|nr:hypothetical protein BC827DRAFT_1268936 [Russula dissimulans]
MSLHAQVATEFLLRKTSPWLLGFLLVPLLTIIVLFMAFWWSVGVPLSSHTLAPSWSFCGDLPSLLSLDSIGVLPLSTRTSLPSSRGFNACRPVLLCGTRVFLRRNSGHNQSPSPSQERLSPFGLFTSPGLRQHPSWSLCGGLPLPFDS